MTQLTHTEPAGALALWRAELKAGKRTRATTDTLFLAACAEMNGLDAKREGLPLTASIWFAKAEAIVIDAAKAKAREDAA
jgi:hypothetical protein